MFQMNAIFCFSKALVILVGDLLTFLSFIHTI